MVFFLCVQIVFVTLLCVQVFLHRNDRLDFFVPIYVVAIVGIMVVIAALLIDLLSGKEKVVSGKIVQKHGKIIHMVTEQGELKKYRIHNQDAIHGDYIVVDQEYDITLTKLTNYPTRIRRRTDP